MTYVTEQTSQELRAHMRRLKAMAGWHEPLADRLYKEILELDDAVSKLREAQAVQPAQQPFAWYDPSADKFTRDRDAPSMNRGAVLWRLYRDAQPSQAMEPDMFWNHDDAEKLYDSVDEFLNDEICNGTPLEVGDIRTIQCAIRLPNFDIRVTAVDDEECEAEYEVIAAINAKGVKP